MKTGESIKLAKGQFCVNHPWRHAYAVCNVCRLPYCYIDIMQDQGKLYCLNDIDQSATSSDADLNPSVNSFTAISSVIFLANSALLGYYVYPQALYLATNAVNSGTISSLLTIGQSYYLPLANMAIVVFGVIAAFSVFRKSIYGFALGLLVSMVGLMLVLYEYLNSSVPYLFVSSALLLLSLASMTYSKMSAAKEVIEQNSTVSEIEWPKTETY